MSIEEGETYIVWRRKLAELRSMHAGDKLAMPQEQTPVDEMLTGDHGRQSFAAGQDIREPPEFQEHQCWRMMHIWPLNEDGPERVECSGCGAVGRIEWEYKP